MSNSEDGSSHRSGRPATDSRRRPTHARPRRDAWPWPAGTPRPDGLKRWVALFTRADLDAGVEGGMGLIAVTARARGARIARWYHDGMVDGLSTSEGAGRAELFARARQRAFDAVIVSDPASLGNGPAEVRRALLLLGALGIEVHAGPLGRLVEADLP